jgi:hypothetical protein
MAIEGITNTYHIPPVKKEQEIDANRNRKQKKDSKKGRREEKDQNKKKEGKIDIRI